MMYVYQLDPKTVNYNQRKEFTKKMGFNYFYKPSYYIVPMKRMKAGETILLHSIIPAVSAQRAMYLAEQEFKPDGWSIDPQYQNYKII